MDFAKYHGSGNDFILIDNRTDFFSADRNMIANLCHRHLGIGADGLILLNSSEEYDFEMLYYNSDGNLATMCGNGGRCVVAFAKSLGIIQQQTQFKAADGIHTAEILSTNRFETMVRLSLNDVSFIHQFGNDWVLNTGSPHLVRFVKYQDLNNYDVDQEGRRIRYQSLYKDEGTNVNFVAETSDGIFVRTYERGVEAETLSCGTGVTASAIAYSLVKNLYHGPIKVLTRGGDLKVNFERENEKFIQITLTGPATFVFHGRYTI
ncbi:MAG TPA: diaminopimelate epimerase [Bacteroidales bacterium]|jgi:diaminopimelate epimerase|nr:diaminopimelate epimerase [Bacteroidales bacterium]